jgi:acetyl esterase/lipase
MVCATANYRLRPDVGHDEQITDCLAAIEWVRSHARGYGGDPNRIFLVGSSAGVYLSIAAVNAGADGIAGIVGRYGYYGDLMPERPWPPILVIHGENDLLVRPSDAREFVERTRAGSSQPAEYVELPGGHHNFDLYESIRSNAVSIAVARFITSSGTHGTGEST